MSNVVTPHLQAKEVIRSLASVLNRATLEALQSVHQLELEHGRRRLDGLAAPQPSRASAFRPTHELN